MPQARTYDVDPSWQMPDLAAPLSGDVRLDEEVSTLRTLFFDTADRNLYRRGITVLITADVCTVRLPDGEFTYAAGRPAVPREVAQLLLGVRGGKRLRAIAKTEVARTVVRIVTPDPNNHAVLVDDVVTATASDISEVTEQRREITLTASDKELIATLDTALQKAGARPAQRGDVERLVALTSLRPAAHLPTPAESTLGRLVADYLDEQHDALLHGDIGLRRGAEVVHAVRVATRRYRSVLRAFADVFDPERAARLDTELRWYAQLLGHVRDPQVQRAHLHEAVGAVPPELVLGPVAARIDEHLLGEQLRAVARLDRAMRSKRYLALLEDLDSWHDRPPVTGRAAPDQQCAVEYLRKAERTLAKRLAAVQHGDDETLHSARKAAKRARYTAELASPALGKPATRTVARSKKLQDLLGEHQDSVVACAILRRLGAGTAGVPNENGFTFGLLHHAERHRADLRRAQAVKAAHRK